MVLRVQYNLGKGRGKRDNGKILLCTNAMVGGRGGLMVELVADRGGTPIPRVAGQVTETALSHTSWSTTAAATTSGEA